MRLVTNRSSLISLLSLSVTLACGGITSISGERTQGDASFDELSLEPSEQDAGGEGLDASADDSDDDGSDDDGSDDDGSDDDGSDDDGSDDDDLADDDLADDDFDDDDDGSDDDGSDDDGSDDDGSDDDGSDDDGSDDDGSDDDGSDDDVAADDDLADDDLADDDSDDDDVAADDDSDDDDVAADDDSDDDDVAADDDDVMTDPLAPLPAGCEEDYRRSNSDYCELELFCSEDAGDVAGGTSSSSQDTLFGYDGDFTYSYCYQADDGSWACDCEGSSGFWNLTIAQNELSSDGVCVKAAALCRSSPAPVFETESQCEIVATRYSSESCFVETDCAANATIAPGVEAVQYTWHSVGCSTEDGATQCYCNGRNIVNPSFRFAEELDLSGTQLCHAVRDLCAAGDIELSVPTCELATQSASQTSCSEVLRCEQSTTIAGLAAYTMGEIRTSCQETDTGTFECECSGGAFGDTVTVEGTSSFEVCASISQSCKQRVLDSGVSLTLQNGDYYGYGYDDYY